MNFQYKTNNGKLVDTDVRVYTGDLYGDGEYLCTERTLYLDLKNVWDGGESITMGGVDFYGQTTDLDEFINPDNFTSYKNYELAMKNLLDPEMTSKSNLWTEVRKYIRKNTVTEEQFYA